MPNKAKDFYTINPDYFTIFKNPDYCSFCAGWKTKMVNHTLAHKLRAKNTIEAQLAFFWYRQDKTLPDHLRENDPRLDNYLLRKQQKELQT